VTYAPRSLPDLTQISYSAGNRVLRVTFGWAWKEQGSTKSPLTVYRHRLPLNHDCSKVRLFQQSLCEGQKTIRRVLYIYTSTKIVMSPYRHSVDNAGTSNAGQYRTLRPLTHVLPPRPKSRIGYVDDSRCLFVEWHASFLDKMSSYEGIYLWETAL
jgi:hypothetical protein